MSSNHIILCCPLLLSVFPSIRVFSNESALRTRWPKYWSFSFSIGASKEYSGLTSFRTDWFDLLPEVLSASPWGVHMSRGWGSEWRQAEMGSSHAQKNLSRETYSRDVPGMCTHWRRGTRTVSWGGAGSGWSLERWVEVAREAGLQRRSLSKGLEVEENMECLEKLGCLLERTGLFLLHSVHRAFPSRRSRPRAGPAMEAGTRWEQSTTSEWNSPIGILAPPEALPWTKVQWVSWNHTSAIMRWPVLFSPYFIFIHWNIVDLQCVVSGVQQSESGMHIHISAFFLNILFPYRSSQSIK